jgi:hypothetical protein
MGGGYTYKNRKAGQPQKNCWRWGLLLSAQKLYEDDSSRLWLKAILEQWHLWQVTSRGLFRKNSCLQAKQSIPHTAVVFYSNCIKGTNNPELCDKRTGCCIVTMHSLKLSFPPGNFFTKNMIVVPHPPYSPDLAPCDFYLFSWLKLELQGRNFDTIEVIEAESQTVLNTLTGHDFQEAFTKLQKCWELCVCAEGLLLEWWWSVRPKFVFIRRQHQFGKL